MTIFLLIVALFMIGDLVRIAREIRKKEPAKVAVVSPVLDETSNALKEYGKTIKDCNKKLNYIVETLEPIAEYYKNIDNESEGAQNGTKH